MSRLEIIKDDLKIFNATTEANVVWLMERLEIAQKALEYISESVKVVRKDVWDRVAVEVAADKALDQLKE
jgi:hypothetical protein